MASEGLLAARSLMRSAYRPQLTVAGSRFLSYSSRVAAPDALKEVETNSSMSAPIPDVSVAKTFNTEERIKARETQLPGKR